MLFMCRWTIERNKCQVLFLVSYLGRNIPEFLLHVTATDLWKEKNAQKVGTDTKK